MKFKRKLDRARSANLVERVETTIRTTGPETAREGLRRVAEQRIGQAVVGIAEIGMVENIEKLRPESQIQLFRNPKLPLESYVRLRCPQASQHIAPEITLRALGRWSKSRFVENLPARILRAKKLQTACPGQHSGEDTALCPRQQKASR